MVQYLTIIPQLRNPAAVVACIFFSLLESLYFRYITHYGKRIRYYYIILDLLRTVGLEAIKDGM